MNTRPLPQLSATIYVALRTDADHILTAECVRDAHWRMTPGSTVRVSIYGMRDFQGEAPGLIGRRLVDGGAGAVEIQATCRPELLRALKQDIQTAMESYAETMATL